MSCTPFEPDAAQSRHPAPRPPRIREVGLKSRTLFGSESKDSQRRFLTRVRITHQLHGVGLVWHRLGSLHFPRESFTRESPRLRPRAAVSELSPELSSPSNPPSSPQIQHEHTHDTTPPLPPARPRRPALHPPAFPGRRLGHRQPAVLQDPAHSRFRRLRPRRALGCQRLCPGQ